VTSTAQSGRVRDTSSDRMTARSRAVALFVYRAEHSDRMIDRNGQLQPDVPQRTLDQHRDLPLALLKKLQVWAPQITLSGRV
jgi:hypothetical protein